MINPANAGRSGVRLNVPEAKRGTCYRLFGGPDELMVTFEHLSHPVNLEVLQQSLSSAVTGQMEAIGRSPEGHSLADLMPERQEEKQA